MDKRIWIAVFVCLLGQTTYVGLRMVCQLDGLAEGAGPVEVGVMMALVALLPTFLAIAVGRYVDANGCRKPIAAAALLFSAAIAFPAALPASEFGLWPLYAGCSLLGIANVFISVVIQRFVGFISSPENKSNHFTMYSLAFSAGLFVAPVTCGLAIDTFGFFATFAYLFVFVALMAASLILFSRTWPEAWPQGKARARQTSLSLLRIAPVRNCLVASTFNAMAWDLQNFMIPVYGTAVGLTATEIGTVMGAFSAGTFAVRVFMPAIAKVLTQWRTIAAAFAVTASAFFLFPLFSSFYPLTGVAFFLGLGLGAGLPNLLAIADTSAPEGRLGEVLGLRTTFINIFHIVLPVTFGIAGTAFGAAVVFYGVAGVMGGMSGFSLKCEKVEREHLRARAGA